MAFCRVHLSAVVFAVYLTIAVCGCASSGGKKTYTATERARMLVDIANAALMEGDAIGALQNLLRAEKEDPKLPEIYHSKALAYFAKHDLKTAISEVKKALKLFPEYPDANNTFGKFLIDQGNYEAAVKPLSLAAVNPLYRDAFKAYTNLGILYYRRGNYTQASVNLDKAIQAAPNSACIALYYRGHIRLRESRLNEAIASYDQATRKYCVSFVDAHLALGIAYEKTRQYAKAREKFLEIQQRYPNTETAEKAVSHLRYLP